jgi:hypothetical protein
MRYRKAYETELGTNTRMAFAFANRVPCTDRQLETIRSAAAQPGLRRYSLPGEYGAVAAAP